MIFSSRARTAHGCPGGTVRSWFAVTRSDASNRPAPLAPAEMRPVFEHPVPFGGQHLRLLPPWDAGSGAYGYEFGKLTSNPIGNNIVAARPVSQPFSMMTGSQANGAIFFAQQTINGGAQPELGQLYDPKVLQALLEYQQQNGA